MTPSSHMGDMGDMGDMGNVGHGGGAAAGTLPDRADLPYLTDTSEVVWSRDALGNWTSATASKPLKDVRVASPIWTAADWEGRWRAWLILAEFAATDWRTSITLEPWDTTKIDEEIGILIKYAEDERPDALGEIIAQNASYEDFMAYFTSLLRITRSSHPKMFQLLHVAGTVGILVSMYFKQNPAAGRDPRVRPSQLCPALLPPLAVPGHPAFPSGHATQSMLMALIAGEVMEARNGVQGGGAVWKPLLQQLACRIARNREIAGLHYPSDTRAGFELARKTFNKLRGGTLFSPLFDAAVAEWPGA